MQKYKGLVILFENEDEAKENVQKEFEDFLNTPPGSDEYYEKLKKLLEKAFTTNTRFPKQVYTISGSQNNK